MRPESRYIDYSAVQGLRTLDVSLLLSALGLVVIGLVMVASASVEYAQAHYGHWWWLVRSHFQHLLVALACGYIVFCIPLRLWYATIPMLLPLGLIALVLVLVPGIGMEANGSRRWLFLGGVTFQPSEFIKLLMIVYMARFLANDYMHASRVSMLRYWAWPMALGVVLCVLLLAEPDMGTFFLLMCCALLMLFLSGMHLQIYLVLCSVLALLCALLVVFSPYRWARILSFMDPWRDPTGSGYQLSHALNAVRSGEWWGRGLGHSLEKQLYLPAAHTDFIFAVITEELGWLGASCLIALFCFLVARMWHTASMAQQCKAVFVMYAVYGISLLIALQVFINIGVNLGLLPTKGMTLPFVSYGGSSLVLSCVLVAWVLRARKELCLGSAHSVEARY